jgi:hypothetical protein
MAELSPQAQAVLTAQASQRCLQEMEPFNDPPCHPCDPGWNGCGQCVDRLGLAAALTTIAEQFYSDWSGMACAEHLKEVASQLRLSEEN